MSLFQIDGEERLVLNPDVLAIPPFKKIWDHYPDKKEAEKWLVYVFYFSESNRKKNPYSEMMEAERELELKTHWIGDKSVRIPKFIREACEEYKKFKDTFKVRVARAARHAVEQMAGYLEEVDFTKTTKNEKGVEILLYDPNDVMAVLNKLPVALKGLDQIEKSAAEPDEDDNRIVGGGEVGEYEN